MKRMNRHDLNLLMDLRKELLLFQLEQQGLKKEKEALKRLEKKAR